MKKIILITIGLLAIITLIVFIYGNNAPNADTYDKSEAVIQTFLNNIEKENYGTAYELVKNNQDTREQFIEYMTQINKVVNIEGCAVGEFEAGQNDVVTAVCPYKSSNRSLRIVFALTEEAGNFTIASYDMGYQ